MCVTASKSRVDPHVSRVGGNTSQVQVVGEVILKSANVLYMLQLDFPRVRQFTSYLSIASYERTDSDHELAQLAPFSSDCSLCSSTKVALRLLGPRCHVFCVFGQGI